MGYLENSNAIVKQTSDALDQILQSKATLYLQGLGDPVLVNWWNMNDTLSTADNGTGTVDAIMGKASPFRYNKIENLPAYGVAKDIQNLEMAMDDNGIMDMQLEIEPVLLPNTIIPGPYDYMEYVFSNGRNVFFRANDVKIMTVKSNGFYKVPMHLVDIDSEDYPTGISEITVKTMKVKLDNVGSNEKCIISDKVFDDIEKIESILKLTISDYIDTFFVRKYNSFILRGFDKRFTIYDPYLTSFIIKHSLMEFYEDDFLQPIVIEQDDNFRTEYNRTVLRAVELRDVSKIMQLVYELTSFTKPHTNPFAYWGEELVYLIKSYQDEHYQHPNNKYMGFEFLYHIPQEKESASITMMENLIIRYFQKDTFDKFMTLDELKELDRVLEMEYNEHYFYLIPILLYILNKYKKHLNNDYS